MEKGKSNQEVIENTSHNVKDTIKMETQNLYKEGVELAQAFHSGDVKIKFHYDYQSWYTRALKIVEVLAKDRYSEFRSYYEIDPKRKKLGYGTYVIQDFFKGVIPSELTHPDFDTKAQVIKGFLNQLTILNSLIYRIDSALNNIEEGIYIELQDAELNTAKGLLKVNLRAAGALAGVVIETYLQKVAKQHAVSIAKKNPTISDLNDPLKNAGVIDTPTWRKISYLADIRNLCAHKKDVDPSKEQTDEIIEGANWLIKNVY